MTDKNSGASGFTPGPWRISEQSPTIIKEDMRMIGSDSGRLIGSAAGYENSGFFVSDDEAIANARLIAAAPDLLAALEMFYKMDWRAGPVRGEYDAARKAIAKAIGQTTHTQNPSIYEPARRNHAR